MPFSGILRVGTYRFFRSNLDDIIALVKNELYFTLLPS